MLRKALAFLLVFTILIPAFSEARASELTNGLPTEEEIATDVDIQQLQALVADLVQRFESVDRQALQQAIIANDVALAEAMMGFLPGESEVLAAQLRGIGAGLDAKYPGMKAVGLEMGGPQVEASSTPGAPSLASCKWLLLAAALALCTGSGPFYWVCAYAAICGSCSGGDFESLCW